MASIRDIYSYVHRATAGGIEGYEVDKKYYDPMKMKEERELSKSKDQARSKKPNVSPKKTTFIDELQKKEAKMPGPCTYEPKELLSKSKTESLANPSRRKTIFDEMEQQVKKANYPAAGLYDKVQVEADKKKLKPNISKAEKSNYLDSSMRSSLDCPGVGNYNDYHHYDKRAAKWVATKEKKSDSKSLKLPPVGTYSPLPVAYELFENELATKKRHKSFFSKQQRFKKGKDKTVPFYNVLSEWGMKDKRVKKDILARLSSPSSHRSVYH